MEKQNGIEVPDGMNLTIGGDDDSDEANVQGHVEKAPESAPQKTSGTYFLGSKKFDSAEDRDQYAAEMHEKLIRLEAQAEVNKPSKTYENANQVDISDLMFTDPKAYTQVLREEAVKEATTLFKRDLAEKQVWDNFYTKNPTFKDRDLAPLVEFQFNKLKNDNPNLPAHELLDKVSKEVSNLITKVKGKPEGGKELPGGTAVVAGTTNNNSTPRAVAKEEPTDMATQMRNARKRGR